MNNQRQRFQPPELYSISRGTVSRIEPYGCFVKLINSSSPISGLVHISQLHASRITDVNDVVNLDDEVWVKVMDVQVENIEDNETGRTRQRHKIKLSMKYVHQDTGHDLDPENEQLEGDLQRSKGGGGGGGGTRGNANDGTVGGANSQLGRSLASNIGMSIAIDPGNLILKGKSGAAIAANTDFNGYALVGEEEGEALPSMEKQQHVVEVKAEPVAVVRSMGRGRGTTLPAWMTRSDPEDRLGSAAGMPNDKETTKDKEEDGRRKSSDNHKSKKRDKRHRKERHGRKQHKKHKDRKCKDDRRGRSRSNSHSSYSSSSSRSLSRSRSRSPSERRSHSKSHRKRKSHRNHRRRHREDRSRSRDDDDGSPRQSSDFTNVEEARAIMERLERRR